MDGMDRRRGRRGPGRGLFAPAPDGSGRRINGMRAFTGMPLGNLMNRGSTAGNDIFHPDERRLQRERQTEALWDETRRQRLLWREIPEGEIPEAVHARIEDPPSSPLPPATPPAAATARSRAATSTACARISSPERIADDEEAAHRRRHNRRGSPRLPPTCPGERKHCGSPASRRFI